MIADVLCPPYAPHDCLSVSVRSIAFLLSRQKLCINNKQKYCPCNPVHGDPTNMEGRCCPEHREDCLFNCVRMS